MSNLSPAVILYNADGVAMSVSNGVAIPVGTNALIIAGSDGTNSRFVRTANDGTVRVDPSGTTAQPVTGTFFQATQPVSAAALPLPSGAATSALQTQPGVDIGDVTVNNGVGVAAVNVQDGGNSITVDGTFWQATQPVSAASLPLPAGAATSLIQTDGTQKTQVTSLPALPTGTNTIGKVDQGLGGASAWKVDGSAVTQPVSAAALPLPTGAATSALQTQPGVDIGDVTVNNAAGAAAVNIQDGGNSITVDAVSLPLPTGAATETTLSAINTKTPALGQAAMVASSPVVIASNQTVIPVNDNGGSLTVDGTVTANAGTGPWPVTDNGGSLTVDTPQLPAALVGGRLDVVVGAALPAGTNNIGDVDVLSVPAPLSTTGGGTEAAALRVTIANDSTGVLSVDDNGGSLTVDTPQLPAALVGARLDINNGAWLGSTAPTVGQKTMAASVPVVLASDQSTVVVAEQKSSTAAHTNVASALASVTLLAANAARRGATIYNDGNKNLFVKLGATASATSFTVKLSADSYLEVPFGYTGVIDGIWDVVNGSARVVEFT